MLTAAAFIALVELHLIHSWVVVIIIGREFAVSGLRAVASAEGFIIAASEMGKIKMTLQVAAITTLFSRALSLDLLGVLLLWLVVISALISGAHYFWLFWRRYDASLRNHAAEPPMVVLANSEHAESEKSAKESDVAAH